MEHESDNITCNWFVWNDPRALIRVLVAGALEIGRTKRDQINCSIVKIGQNTEWSPRDFREFLSFRKTITLYWCEKLSNE